MRESHALARRERIKSDGKLSSLRALCVITDHLLPSLTNKILVEQVPVLVLLLIVVLGSRTFSSWVKARRLSSKSTV